MPQPLCFASFPLSLKCGCCCCSSSSCCCCSFCWWWAPAALEYFGASFAQRSSTSIAIQDAPVVRRHEWEAKAALAHYIQLPLPVPHRLLCTRLSVFCEAAQQSMQQIWLTLTSVNFLNATPQRQPRLSSQLEMQPAGQVKLMFCIQSCCLGKLGGRFKKNIYI